MTKQDLIDRVFRARGRKGGLPPTVTRKAVGALVEAVFDELATYFVAAKVTRSAQPRFSYPGFGTFTKKKRVARAGRDPRSGEPIEIPARITLAFSPGQGLRVMLNRK